MERRVLLFFVLSFLIIFGMNYVFGPKPPVKRPGSAPTPAAQAPVAGTTQTLGQPTATATPAAPATTTTIAQAPAAPAVNRAKAPTVTYKNDEIAEIVFSTRGAVPVRWDIIDQRFAVPAPGESRESMKKKGIKASESLIHPDLNKVDLLPRPFETILFGTLEASGSGYYNNFNTDVYTTETVTQGKLSGFRFTSPPSQTGLRMIKTYLFQTGKFDGKFTIELVNEGKYNLSFDRGGNTGLGVIMGPGLGPIPELHTRNTMVVPAIKSYDGLYYNQPGKPGEVETYPGDKIDWGGMQSMYFLQALAPVAPAEFAGARVVLDPNIAQLVPNPKMQHFYANVELYGRPFSIKPGERLTFQYDFFVGPKERSILVAADHEFTRSMFYTSWNWVRAICIAMLKMLVWLQKLFVNWGVAIIILTIIVRILTFPLVQKGMKSQAKMMAEQQRLKPLMDKINEKFKNDPQRKQQEIFKLYKEHGVNPFGAFKGCIWLFIQMPILVALYHVINQAIDLRGAHFLWIQDLSEPDRLFRFGASIPLIGRDFNVLPLIMAATQIVTSKISAQPSTDPQQAAMQKQMTYMMPVMMLFIFYGMPSGLVLYWTVSNIWQIGQQYWVNKHMPKPGAPAAPAAAATKKA